MGERDLRDPRTLMDRLAEREALVERSVWLVVVDEPAPEQEQRILAVRRLPWPVDHGRQSVEFSDLLYAVMHELPIPPRDRERRIIAVTVVVRPGYNVPGPEEKFWHVAWRYSNHNTGAMDTDTIIVTEHGCPRPGCTKAAPSRAVNRSRSRRGKREEAPRQL